MPQPGISRKNERMAAVLSALFPGLGQVYSGEIAKGIIFIFIGIILLVTIRFLVGIVLFPIFWIYNIYDAYDTTKQISAGLVRV